MGSASFVGFMPDDNSSSLPLLANHGAQQGDVATIHRACYASVIGAIYLSVKDHGTRKLRVTIRYLGISVPCMLPRTRKLPCGPSDWTTQPIDQDGLVLTARLAKIKDKVEYCHARTHSPGATQLPGSHHPPTWVAPHGTNMGVLFLV